MFRNLLASALGYARQSGDGPNEPDPCAECELKCSSATVTPHEYHVLVRLPREDPPASSSSSSPSTTAAAWWPETLSDRLTAFETILEDKKRIKATAFEYPDDPPRAFQHEAFVFSRRAKVSSSTHLVAAAAGELVELVRDELIRMEADGGTGDSKFTLKSKPESSSKNTYIVCAHSARDARCGARGPGIAAAISKCSPNDTVILSSHVGGHLYAGNVIVYGSGSASGTWFGGVHEQRVEQLLAGIAAAERAGIDPAQSEDLRPYWRGTSGRSKEDQASFFVACGGGARGDIEDIVA